MDGLKANLPKRGWKNVHHPANLPAFDGDFMGFLYLSSINYGRCGMMFGNTGKLYHNRC
jgi:hypothetical protein